MAISIPSFNLHGWNQGSSYLSSPCDINDIIVIQEHWLLPHDLTKVNNFDARFVGISSSAMSNAISKGVLVGRPYGGMGVLVSKGLMNQFKGISITERLIVISIGDILICNVYLPNCTVSETYDDSMLQLLAEIRNVINMNRGLKVIICGDFNFDFDGHQS